LEYLEAPFTDFITLTYSDEHLPEDGSLNPEHLTRFWKRLRKNESADKKDWIRYFACGEYGEKRGRPHYHAMVFHRKEFRFGWAQEERGQPPVVVVSPYHTAWLKDCRVDVRPLLTRDDGPRVAAYVAGYVVKKWTTLKRMPDGRHPEFSRQSRCPGIGLRSVPELAESLKRKGVERKHADGSQGSVIGHLLRVGGKTYPIDRVLRNKLLDALPGEADKDMLKKLTDRRLRTLAMEADYEEEIARDQEAEARAAKSIRNSQRQKAQKALF
jgi:hypothetical protein